MFFVIKFLIISLFLITFFLIPLGSRSLYGHLRAIGKTEASQELKKEFSRNLEILEAWARANQALAGEEPGADKTTSPPSESGKPKPAVPDSSRGGKK